MIGFDNESAMVDKIQADVQTPNVKSDILGGIVFTNLPPGGSTLPSHIRYKIRLSSSPRSSAPPSLHLDPFKQDTSWKTAYMFPPFQKVGPRENASLHGGDPGKEKLYLKYINYDIFNYSNFVSFNLYLF